MKYLKLFVCFLMIVFSSFCYAQNKTAPTSNATSATKKIITVNGPQAPVSNIKHDKIGNILISSFEGIFRYDGKSFTNLTSKVVSASFWDVLEDRRGNLWIASLDSGVYYYDGKSFQHYTSKDGLGSNRVWCIYEDKAGSIWFGTDGGATRYDGKSFRHYPIETFQANPNIISNVHSIIEDKTGKFLFGTSGYACVFDGKTCTPLTNKDGSRISFVRSIIRDKKGNIWLGSNTSLWRYDGKTFSNFPGDALFIREGKKGNIWALGISANNGRWTLSRYDEKPMANKKPTVIELNQNLGMMPGILAANDGTVWYGASDGVYRYDGNTITRL
jgi:ligand-binding sensor domain-containing protein